MNYGNTYKRVTNNRGAGSMLEHRLLAEKALGKPLSPGAEIHHYGGILDNTKLVICPDAEYHRLIDLRQKSYDACGNANYRRCYICKGYDDPKNLVIQNKPSGRVYHRACDTAEHMKRYNRQKGLS